MPDPRMLLTRKRAPLMIRTRPTPETRPAAGVRRTKSDSILDSFIGRARRPRGVEDELANPALQDGRGRTDAPRRLCRVLGARRSADRRSSLRLSSARRATLPGSALDSAREPRLAAGSPPRPDAPVIFISKHGRPAGEVARDAGLSYPPAHVVPIPQDMTSGIIPGPSRRWYEKRCRLPRRPGHTRNHPAGVRPFEERDLLCLSGAVNLTSTRREHLGEPMMKLDSLKSSTSRIARSSAENQLVRRPRRWRKPPPRRCLSRPSRPPARNQESETRLSPPEGEDVQGDAGTHDPR